MQELFDEIKRCVEQDSIYEGRFTTDDIAYEQEDNLTRFDISPEILKMLGIERDTGISIEMFKFPGTSIVDVSIQEQ